MLFAVSCLPITKYLKARWSGHKWSWYHSCVSIRQWYLEVGVSFVISCFLNSWNIKIWSKQVRSVFTEGNPETNNMCTIYAIIAPVPGHRPTSSDVHIRALGPQIIHLHIAILISVTMTHGREMARITIVSTSHTCRLPNAIDNTWHDRIQANYGPPLHLSELCQCSIYF